MMLKQVDFFEELESKGISISHEQRKAIENKLNEIMDYEPKIGIFGKTGVGKSSLCNSLFGKDICPISDVEACTRNPQEVIVGLGQKGLKLLDVPGVGESSERDKEYSQLYAKLMPELDLVLWVIKADDRALTSDEVFYKSVVKPHVDEGKPFFFVLNQVDKIEPFREWDEDKSEPGPKQFQNIHRKIEDVATFFGITASRVIPVSANEKYNLTKLVDEIVFALPKEKKLTVFREVEEEHQSQVAQGHVKRSVAEVIGDTIVSVVETAGRVVEKVVDRAIDFIEKLPIPRLPWGRGKSSSGGCYITTATMQFLNKPDDCYELNTLRKYRDNWLANQSDGIELINKYYEIAPKLVDIIDSSSNKDEIYNQIWVNYISKCLKFIENKQYSACKELYIEMVHHLESEVTSVVA
ncbi:GTPase family protein [Cytobacillus gottheilii]|uniref:50S ribosome-binding GTPase n=1 Tax=Cytobacillus gottheilii TaxID=859144 RepID=A0ABX8FCI6_9BACI|nr:GTPase [Cytobacillus gottheilii]QVY61277.1 50S ribosome-binding GTPase [Cytobacillus gottheilii]